VPAQLSDHVALVFNMRHLAACEIDNIDCVLWIDEL